MKLNSSRQITWSLENQAEGITGVEIHFGQGPQPIQVALAQCRNPPTRAQLKILFAERKGNLNTLIVAAQHEDQTSLYGPDSDTEVMKQKTSTAEAILNSILEQPSEILAYQRATSIWRSKQTTDLVGFTNNGLFASHYIRSSINHHPIWEIAQDFSQKIQNLRDSKLIEALGFEITSTPSNTFVLSAKGEDRRAVAILLDQSEGFDSKSVRVQATPVEWGLAVAAEQGAPWVIAVKDSQLRLYPAKDGVGVGQKSQVETYFEIDLITIEDDKAGLLHLIFSAEALSAGGTADELLLNSKKFAAELGVRLRERVYESVVPFLATEVANQLRAKGQKLDTQGLRLCYELTLRILFRLLFQAYAEDRGLLPSGRNENFDRNSLKHWAQYLLRRDLDAPYGEAATIWYDLIQIWDAIDQGNPDMQVPAYNGGLFGSDPELHPEGALIRTLSIPDRVLGPALRSLVIDDNTEDGVAGPVDFRSLSVREFGTIYEGLLESSLSVADRDLTVDAKGAWVPANENDLVLAKADEVYFHSASGERRATGSYYTPSFIVDHLIERSVEPALNEHLSRVKELIDAGDQSGAYKQFFDFRVADLAMGSAHFLVAAIDKIETIMRTFLLQPGNEIDGVNAELIRLEQAAKDALGRDEAAYAEIERASLLRRQLARRCIYGLDINSMAVELSRLAIWIHTFVPGLPMSSLEHNLVCANSLTGIGSVDEGLNALIPNREKMGTSLFDSLVEGSLSQARDLLEDAANEDEADKSQSMRATKVSKEARKEAQRAKIIFDLAVANRNSVISSSAALTEEDLDALYSNKAVENLVEALKPAHMPYLFPEVMLRDDPGFDVLIGNPPFKKVVIQELDFWNKRFKGLKGLDNAPQAAQIEKYRGEYPALKMEFEAMQMEFQKIRLALGPGTYPGMGIGDPDLYKAFAWRFTSLVRDNGRIGLVLPNSIWNTKGSSEWRRRFFENFTADLVLVSNDSQWAFENVNPGYRFTFIAAVRSKSDQNLVIRGPFKDLEGFLKDRSKIVEPLPARLVLDSAEHAPLPSLEGPKEIDLWKKLLLVPSLSDGRKLTSRADIRCAPATEIHVALDGRDGVFTSKSTDHPVFNHLNVNRYSFDKYVGAFNFANFDEYVSGEEQKAHAMVSRRISSLSLWGEARLNLIGHPARSPRIVFRDVIHASNQRKAWFGLAPANTLLTHKAPYLVFENEDLNAQAYVLGVLNSGVVDWFASLGVGLNMTFFILYTLPVPEYVGSERQLLIASTAASLAISDQGDFGDWKSLGSPIQDETSRVSAMAKIDALVALELGLNDSEIKLIHGSGNPLRSSDTDVFNYMENLV